MLYAFKLGRNKELSIAEIAAVFGERRLEQLIDEHLIVHTAEQLDESYIDRLGGTIKISRVTDECSAHDLVSKITDLILKNCNTDSKLTYAINIEPLSNNSKRFLRKLLIDVKKSLKARGAKPRFINKLIRNESKNIENVQSKKEILDKENSIEINLINTQSAKLALRNQTAKPTMDTTYLLSHLIGAQDIDNYSKRDYDRPHRDTVNGMLPPKLAQILINLSLAGNQNIDPKDTFIIDPFCGSGGVLMEALLMGFSVIGSDINPTMIAHSKENIEWLRRNFPVHRNQDAIIFEHDATQRFPKAKNTAVIATEGFLGDQMSCFPTDEQIRENFSRIETLYFEFFKNLWHMYAHVTVAVCLPNYVGKNRVEEPHGLIEKIKELGFEVAPLISSNLNFKLGGERKDTSTFLYFREDQFVGRRVCVFQK